MARLLALLACLLGIVAASPNAGAAEPAPGVRVPSYWDARVRVEKPNLTGLRVVRFATGEAFPPFHYSDGDGQPVGFAVDIARAICVELAIQCTLQAFRWELLPQTIGKGQADAIIAMVRPTDPLWQDFTMSARFYQPMARFVGRRQPPIAEVTPEALAGRSVGVIAGTGYEAYLHDFFPDTVVRSFVRPDDARAALKAGAVDALFGDAVAMSLWLNGSSSEQCCQFVGEAFVEPKYFGEGVGVLTARENEVLARAIAYALHQLDAKGTFAEIYLRHFPLGYY